MANVYLLDDHAILRDGLHAMLRRAGHEVVGESADPTQALDDLRRCNADVLLLDLHLGERSGFELLRALSARRAAVRVIVLTMSAQARHVAEAMQLGAAGYVLKGAPSRELLAAIEAVGEGRRHLGAEVADLAVRGLTQPDGADRLHSLSARERQIAELVVRGRSSSEIGALLHLSPKTVDTYRSRLMAKLGTADLPALVRLAIRSGIITAEDH